MKYLTNEMRTHLEQVLWDRVTTNHRDTVLLLTAMSLGTRAQELLNLAWPEVNVGQCTIKIKTIKGGKVRILFISRKLMDELLKLKVEGQDKIFPISYSRLKQIWYQYRPCPMPFKSLRHTFAMKTYKNSNDVNLVKYCLGHTSLSWTSVYLEESYSDTQLKKALGVR